MPNIDLSILNQRQTPAFYADVFANRPAAGFVGRIFVSTNTFAFYRDNGTGWDLIGGPGTGTVTGTGANGQVTFWNGASTITGSNDLFWDAANGHFGVNTNIPGTALDVIHDQPTVAILNQTVATNDVRIGFQNNGVGLWRIGAFYNAGANDFGIYDAVAAIQPVTVKKTTGQVLIGTSTVGAGKLVVASATGDNGVQIVGATSPSLRIDNAEVGATKRIGIGLATAVNNFIQNSQNLDMCIFNSSTSAAGNMLFGIYDTGLSNTQEAARISAARNFLIGTIVDAGQKLQVNGTALISGNTTVGVAAATTNVEFNLNGVSGKAQRIQFKNSGTDQWLLGPGAASETSAFELYNASGTIVLSINKSTNASTFAGKVNVVKSIADYALTVTNTDSNGYGMYLQAGGTNNAIDVYNAAGTQLFNLSGSGSATFRTPGNTTGLIIRHLEGTNNPGLFITTNESNRYVSLTASGSSVTGQLLQLGAWGNAGTLNISASNVLIGTTTDSGNKLQVNGAIKTASPSGGTAGSWKLGTASSGAAIQGGTVRIEINGIAYDLLTT